MHRLRGSQKKWSHTPPSSLSTDEFKHDSADFPYLWFRLLSCRSRGNRRWPWPQWLQSCPGATRGRWRPVCHSWCSWSLHTGRSATAAAAPEGKQQERREMLSFKERRRKGGCLPVKHTPDTRGLRSGSWTLAPSGPALSASGLRTAHLKDKSINDKWK